jgi:hypothetical protein
MSHFTTFAWDAANSAEPRETAQAAHFAHVEEAEAIPGNITEFY